MKKALLLLLTIMTLGFVTAPLSAQNIWDGTADVSWYDDAQTSFDISTPEQLAGVAQLMTTTNFSGKILNLTADIWLNADNDSTNNWTPIGGYATATGEDNYSTSAYAFKGTFKGNGHTIYNMYCDKSNYFQAGLFGCVSYPCTIDSLVLVNPVVKAKGMSGSLVGYTQNDGNVYISNCLFVNIRVEATTGNNNGGIIGGNWKMQNGSYWSYITNCGVTGHISGKYIGGIAGNGQKINATNSYFAGTLDPELEGGLLKYGGIVGHCDNGKISITNSYSNVPAPTTYSSGRDGVILTDAEMQTADFIDSLGTAFMMDNGINNGYPIMSYMCGVAPTNPEICAGESVTLTAFGYDSYSWTPGGYNTASITVSPTTTTTYTVTGYTAATGSTGTHSATVTVHPQAIVTAAVVTSADGQVHGTVTPEITTLACGSSDNVTLTVVPDVNYRVSRVTLNGNEVYGDVFGEGTVTVTVNPGGTLADVKVFLSNTYTITTTLLMDDGSTLNNTSLVQPYGSNGVYTVTADGTVNYTFGETARYHVSDITIDDVSYGEISSYDFENVHENHTIVATYTDACGIQALPYTDSFESAVYAQVPECYAKISESSYPYASSSYCHSGSRSIYAYLYTSGYYYFVLPQVIDTLTYPMNSLMLSFWGRSSSTANTFTVGVLTDPTDRNTFTALQTFTPAATNTYEEFVAYFNGVDMSEVYGSYIAIRFDPTTNYSTSYIDDITVDFAPTCSPVRNLVTTSVYGTNATLTWDANTVGGLTEYNVCIYDVTNDIAIDEQTTNTTYMITGLAENTQYRVGVFVTCENGDNSDTSFVEFITPCNSPVAMTVGEGTSSTQGNYLPTNTYYNYSITQQIIPADSLQNTAHDFNGMAFQYFYGTSYTRNMNIYLAHVSDTSLAEDWILPSDDIEFTQVYSGDIVWDNTGTNYWKAITFNTVFSYNGTDDILVTVVDNTGTYSNSSEKFYTHNDASTSSMSMYAYRDASAYDYMNPGVSGNVSSNVNNIQFIYCEASSCIRPNTLTASNVGENDADINWVSAGSGSSWEVEYMAVGDADWTNYGTVSTPSVSLSSLLANTTYQVRVRSVCGSNEYSIWSEIISFRTSCGTVSVASTPWTEGFENSVDDPECWISAVTASYNNHTFPHIEPTASIAHSGSKALEIAFGNIVTAIPQFDESLDQLLLTFWAYQNNYSSSYSNRLELGYITNPNDASTFVPTDTLYFSSYTKYVKSFVDLAGLDLPSTTRIAFRYNQQSSSNYTSWYLDDFTVELLPDCMQPYDLTATSIGDENVTLAWTEMGSSTGWIIEYGEVGFTPGEGNGTQVTADENPYTVEGLTSGTAYDFYVQADCGSNWEGPTTVVTGQHVMNATGSDTLTTCGVVLFDDGGADGNYSTNCNSTLVLYPANPDAKLSLTGTANIENNWDFLYVYDGVGTGNLMATITGENQTVNLLSVSGPLTLRFTSDGTVVKSGFELIASCVTCYPPAGFSASDVSLDAATISWSGNADGYGVYVILSDTTYYTTTDTFLTLNNLAPSATYRVYVRSLCGTDSSALSSAFSFSTSCGQFEITETVPWFEDFEGYTITGGAVPVGACWATPEMQQVDNGVSPFVYTGWSASAYSGQNTLEMKGGPTMVVLPEFSNDINTLRISMWGNTTAYNANDAGYMVLGYISDIYNASTFVAVDTIPATAFNRTGTDAPHANFIGPYDFSGVTPESGLRIALRLTNVTTSATGSSVSWNLDDITVSLTPNCPSPVKNSVAYSNVDAHNATITWVDNDPSHDSWTVYYKEGGETAWQSVVAGPSPTVDLSGLNPETNYEVYVVTNCTVSDQVVDETNHITFSTTIACPAPTDVAVLNVGMTSVTVTWNGTADSYTVEYGENGFVPGTGEIETAVTSPLVLTGLTSGTSYTVYVTADCGGDDGSSSAASFNFSTALCDLADQCTYTFLLYDSWGDGWNGNASLEVQQNGVVVGTLKLTSGSSSTEVLNLCDNQSTSLVWHSGSYDSECSFTVNGPDGTEIYASSGTPSAGTLTTFTTDCSGSGPVIVEPTVLTNQATAITQTSATLNGAITDLGNQTITAQGFEWKATVGGTYTQVAATGTTMSYELSGLTAGTSYTYRAFAATANTTTYGNEVIFTTNAQGQITEPTATTAAASGIMQTSATLNGSISNPDNVAITAQGFEWKAIVGGSYSAVNATGTTMTYNLTGLTANTGYTFRAFVTTANGTHYGNELTFNTLPEDVQPCETPTGLTATDITGESVVISWNGNSNVNLWNIQYMAQGGQLASATSTTNSYTITDLTPATTYQIQVQADCGDGVVSDWSEPLTVTTTGIHGWLENSVTLYPNPANDVVNVQCTMNNVQCKSIEVIDVYGKVIRTVETFHETSLQTTQINVSGLAAGMYFVRLTTDAGMVTKTFVKK